MDSKPYYPVEPPATLLPAARRPRTQTPEYKFWRSFAHSPLPTNLHLPVTSLVFSPYHPSPFLAAAVSTSILFFSSEGSVDGEFSRHSSITSFSDVAYSPSFRCDGALIAAGCGSGEVQVFRTIEPSLPRRKPLRKLVPAHFSGCRVVRYPRAGNDKIHLFSAGDDAAFSYWDVASGERIMCVPGAHKDYIRAGDVSPVSPSVFATGGYDHIVKLWDVRGGGDEAVKVNHGAPVESLLFLPSGGMIATAGGNVVKIWDVIGGGRLLNTVESHNKTVTGLALAKTGDAESGAGMRLLSVSIDGYLKSFDFGEFKITHSMRYPAQLLSVSYASSGLMRVVGTSNGLIYMAKKKKKMEEEKTSGESLWGLPEPENKVHKPTGYRYFRRGQGEKPGATDFVVSKLKRKRISEHDKLLKKFMHKDALVTVLGKKIPRSIVAVMEELVARRKLIKCIKNLDKAELDMLLGFLHHNATKPQYSRFLIGLTKKVLEMHADDIQANSDLRRHIRNFRRVIAEEIKIQSSLQEIQGMISPLLLLAGDSFSG